MSATSTNAMRQFGTALGCCAIGVLTLTMKLARQLVKRFRTEFQAGNPNRLPAELLRRLEGELAEMAKPDAAVNVPKMK
jgi:hypothetical protein